MNYPRQYNPQDNDIDWRNASNRTKRVTVRKFRRREDQISCPWDRKLVNAIAVKKVADVARADTHYKLNIKED